MLKDKTKAIRIKKGKVTEVIPAEKDLRAEIKPHKKGIVIEMKIEN